MLDAIALAGKVGILVLLSAVLMILGHGSEPVADPSVTTLTVHFH